MYKYVLESKISSMNAFIPQLFNILIFRSVFMDISKLAAYIAESPTVKLNAEAAKLRAQGEAIVHFGIGEPKNKAQIGRAHV
jgi:hypothetical protein